MGGWPADLRGVTESVVATLGPNDLWNLAALGLHAPEEPGEPVTARTWGNTRTRRNFRRQGGGRVQFTRDPVDFTEAALSIREEPEPTLDSADAWVDVAVAAVDEGESGGTRWTEWELTPEGSAVLDERVPTTNRGHAAVVEATVAASRLGVDAFDQARLRERLDYFAEVVDTCGGPREREAMARVADLCDWSPGAD